MGNLLKMHLQSNQDFWIKKRFKFKKNSAKRDLNNVQQILAVKNDLNRDQNCLERRKIKSVDAVANRANDAQDKRQTLRQMAMIT